MMIDKTIVNEIERLLAQGQLSQQRIAVLTSVSRGSVSAIATGRRLRQMNPKRRLEQQESSRFDNFHFPDGPIARCPICGAVVKTPCLACQLERLKSNH